MGEIADREEARERKPHDPSQYSESRAYEPEPGRKATREDKGWYSLSRYAVQNDHYNGLYQQWVKPIFFLVGKQHLRWNITQMYYELDTDIPKWRQQPVTNWTFAIYRSLVAKLTKQRPKPEVVPPSGDSEDKASAKLGEAILEFLYRSLRQPQKIKRALAWFLCTGNVAFDVDWDPEAGEVRPRTVLVEIPDPASPDGTKDVPCAADEDGEPIRRASTGPEDLALDGGEPYDLEAEPELEPIGEASLDVDDPMSYRYNPEATSSDDAMEFFVGRMWPIQRICREFDIDEDDIIVGGAGNTDQRQELDDLLSSVTAGAPDPFNNHQERMGSSQRTGIGERALVIFYYRAPDAKNGFPEGRHWITADGKHVWPPEDHPEFGKAGEAPLPNKFWPPRVPIIDTEIPGQPQGLGVLTQVVPLNEKYNFVDARIGEYHTTMAMGGVIWTTTLDRGMTITSEPGQVKPSKGYTELGKPPIREQLHALPAAVYQEREVIVKNLMTIGGVTQMDLSQRPEGVTAGRPMLVMQEASDATITPTLTAMELGMEEVNRRLLVIVQKYYTEERTIKIRGNRGKWEYRSFKGADLVDGLDVRVQTGSTFPWSKSAQIDMKMDMLKVLPGLVVDPKTGKVDREELARILDSQSSGMSTFESDGDPDLVEIDREHDMFEEYDPMDPNKSNELPEVAFYQNSQKHLQGHADFLKRDYGRFKNWSPAAQLAFVKHLELTFQTVEQQVAQAIAAAGAGSPGAPSGGAPAGGGGAPAPGGPAGGEETPGGKKQLQLTRGDRAAASGAA